MPALLYLGNSLQLNPAAVLFISTVGMDYCLTFPVSSKALLMFQELEEETYKPSDLLRLSSVLLLVHLGLKERTDELGAINKAFNRMTETISDRERMVGLTNLPANFASNNGEQVDDSSWQHIPSRLTLHRLLSQLRSQVLQLNYDDGVSLVERTHS